MSSDASSRFTSLSAKRATAIVQSLNMTSAFTSHANLDVPSHMIIACAVPYSGKSSLPTPINKHRPPSATHIASPNESQPILSSSGKDAERTTTPPPITPNNRAKMPLSEPNSSPLSLVSSSPQHTSPAAPNLPDQSSDAIIPSTENGSSSTETNNLLPQTQQPLASASASVSTIVPTSNMGAKRAPKQSPKRAREEEGSDDNEAFGTPLPKRPIRKASKAANGETATKKVIALKKPVLPKKTPAKKPAAAPPPLSSRPSRTRKAPERFEDLQENPTPKAFPRKKGPGKVFDPVYITTNSSSRLVKADVYHMLLEGSAWTSLNPSQQSTLISMLPDNAAHQALLAKISAGETEDTRPAAFTLANDCFRTDVAKFQEDLKNGHLAKTWQQAAEQAVVERARGEYDGWKAEEAEAWWGQKGK
ncbi:hypothetical protein G6011_00087 [Alternaria panax]|uniref:DEUBAD domain-containing protein n=1 Tax=Alternaria panax TaxID=48097 RepID=A0AAD4IHK4_9PLEO|nr:hypothetical protein G6011_00087 [Alternaria panax]